MKNTVFVILWLSLTISGSLFAQPLPSVPTVDNNCPSFFPEIRNALAPSQQQCDRVALINLESQPELDKLYQRLQEVDNSIDNLRWSEEIPEEEAVRGMTDAYRERRKILVILRVAEKEKNRKIIGVLSQKQMQIRDQLIVLAPAIRLFNEAVSMGLIPYDIVYPPIGSGAKGSAGDRMRDTMFRR